jgi:hypothetical protein
MRNFLMSRSRVSMINLHRFRLGLEKSCKMARQKLYYENCEYARAGISKFLDDGRSFEFESARSRHSRISTSYTNVESAYWNN